MPPVPIIWAANGIMISACPFDCVCLGGGISNWLATALKHLVFICFGPESYAEATSPSPFQCVLKIAPLQHYFALANDTTACAILDPFVCRPISFMCLRMHVDLIQPLATRNNKNCCLLLFKVCSAVGIFCSSKSFTDFLQLAKVLPASSP